MRTICLFLTLAATVLVAIITITTTIQPSSRLLGPKPYTFQVDGSSGVQATFRLVSGYGKADFSIPLHALRDQWKVADVSANTDEEPAWMIDMEGKWTGKWYLTKDQDVMATVLFHRLNDDADAAMLIAAVESGEVNVRWHRIAKRCPLRRLIP